MKTHKVQWRDIIGPLSGSDVMTRTELLADVHERSAQISEAGLMDWEKRGFLPCAVVQKHDGLVQATYPRWWPMLISNAYRLRNNGMSRSAIAGVVKTWIDKEATGECMIGPITTVRIAFMDDDGNEVYTLTREYRAVAG